MELAKITHIYQPSPDRTLQQEKITAQQNEQRSQNMFLRWLQGELFFFVVFLPQLTESTLLNLIMNEYDIFFLAS